MNQEEKNSVKSEILLEVTKIVSDLKKELDALKDLIFKVERKSIAGDTELDKKIDKLCFAVETQSSNLDKALKYIELQKEKPEKDKENDKKTIKVALITSSVTFFVTLILTKLFK